MASRDIQARLAGPATAGQSQPDANLSLGGFSSVDPVNSFGPAASNGREVTDITANSTDAYTFSVGGLPDPALGRSLAVGDWVTFHDDNANLSAARELIDVSFTTTTTADVTVGEALPANPILNEGVKFWIPNGLFAAITAAQSVTFPANGIHRLVALVPNNVAPDLADYRAYVKTIQAGPLQGLIAVGTGVSTQFNCLSITADTDEPDTKTEGTAGGGERFPGNAGSYQPQQFDDPRDASLSFISPVLGASTAWSRFDFKPLWIKLAIRDDEPMLLGQRVVLQVIIGNAAETIETSVLVVVDIDGPVEVVTSGLDRTPHVSGGARLESRVVDSASGQPVPNKTVRMSQTTGPGTLGAQNQDQTDRTGTTVYRTYLTGTGAADVVITSVTDSSSVARFNFTPGPTLVVGQKVTVAGFVTNTAYNVTAAVMAVVGSGFFEISAVTFGSDEADGSFAQVAEFDIKVF